MKTVPVSYTLFLFVACGASLVAQVRIPIQTEEVANGVVIRYRSSADLCSGDNLTLLPPRIDPALIGVQGGKRSRLEEFLGLVQDEVAQALKASPQNRSGPARQRNLEVRLVEFRESNRALNVATTLAGGAAIDPGKYRIELVLSAPGIEGELAHAYIDSTPSVRSLLLGNAFSRQSSVRRNIRGQLKKLETFWASRQQFCAARGIQ